MRRVSCLKKDLFGFSLVISKTLKQKGHKKETHKDFFHYPSAAKSQIYTILKFFTMCSSDFNTLGERFEILGDILISFFS